MMTILLAAVGILFAALMGGGAALFLRDWLVFARNSNQGPGEYSFDPDQVCQVELGEKQFQIEHDGQKNWFLEISIHSTWLGKIYPPKIEVQCGEVTSYQYAALGAQGQVYLNLSALSAGSGGTSRVEIRCRRGEIVSETGTLFGFDVVELQGRSLCVVAPHPDDAEIAAFGLYSDEDVRSSVVTVTAGDRGIYSLGSPVRDEFGMTRDTLKGEIRAWDSVTIPNLGGVPFERCYNLGFLDGTLDALVAQPEAQRIGPEELYRRGNVNPELNSSGWQALVDDLAAVFRREQPDIIVCPHPELDSNGDHQRTAQAVVNALSQLEEKALPSELLLYTVHNAVTNFFPFGPPQGSVTVPPVLAKAPVFASTPFSYRLSEAQIVRKQYALEAMHDLRQVTLPEWEGHSSMKEAFHMIVRAAKRIVRVPTETMYSPKMINRASRPNEVFFAVSIENIFAKYESVFEN